MSGFCAVCCAILWARAWACCTVCGRACCALAATHTTATMTPTMIRLARFMSVSLPDHATRRIADSLIKLVDLISRCADVFQQAGPSFDGLNRPFFEFPELLRLALPRSGVNLGVRDGHVQFDNVVCRPVITLFEDHVYAVRITKVIDPGSFIDTGSRYDKRVAVPTTSRISPPSREIRIHKRLTSIGPDRMKAVAPIEMLIQPVRRNYALHRIAID